ncbi:MAG TPA: hypothetical protein VJY35_07735 [Candidatus Eisenbacteria bacterium]|nr:hypothetical protein [Candidatus Eisenbacteria bacterium]
MSAHIVTGGLERDTLTVMFPDSLHVAVLDTIRTVTSVTSPEPILWDRLWPILLGGLLAVGGGLLAQWGRMLLEDRRGKSDLKARIAYDAAALIDLNKKLPTSTSGNPYVPALFAQDLISWAESFESDRRFVGRLASEAFRRDVIDWYASIRLVGRNIVANESANPSGAERDRVRATGVTDFAAVADLGQGLLNRLEIEG